MKGTTKGWRHVRRMLTAAGMGLCTTAFFTPAGAQTGEAKIQNSSKSYSWLSQDTATGDWGGLRTDLANDGLKFTGIYIGQLADNTSGGRKLGADYTQQVNFALDANLEKLFGWDGATFRINLNNRAGRGFSADYSGSRLEQDDIYGAGKIWRLQWLALSQNLFDDKVNLLAGYFSAGSEFGYSPVLANFLDNGLSGHPQILPTDGAGGWNDYPIAYWGERFKIYFAPDFFIKSGVFAVNPDVSSGADGGFVTDFQHQSGVLVPTEAGWTPSFGQDNLVGHYTLGGYFQTGSAPDILHHSLNETGRYALYLLADQMVWRPDPASKRWLSVFGQFVIADRQTLPVTSYLDLGIVFHGPLESRPDDVLNIGWVKENFNPRRVQAEANSLGEGTGGFQYAEQDFELSYCIQFTPWLQFTPALNYVVDPGAYSFKPYKNAFVLNSQLQITF